MLSAAPACSEAGVNPKVYRARLTLASGLSEERTCQVIHRFVEIDPVEQLQELRPELAARTLFCEPGHFRGPNEIHITRSPLSGPGAC